MRFNFIAILVITILAGVCCALSTTEGDSVQSSNTKSELTHKLSDYENNLRGNSNAVAGGTMAGETLEERLSLPRFSKFSSLFKKNRALTKSLNLSPSKIKASDLNSVKTAINAKPEMVKVLQKTPSQIKTKDIKGIQAFLKDSANVQVNHSGLSRYSC